MRCIALFRQLFILGFLFRCSNAHSPETCNWSPPITRSCYRLGKRWNLYTSAISNHFDTTRSLAVRGGADIAVDSQSILDFWSAIDKVGTAIFAFSGAVTAGRKGMDLLGMTIIATITAVGGGTVRDVLLDAGPVFWMQSPVYIEICVFTTLATFLLWPILEERFGWRDSALPICYADAICIGAFAVVGTEKAIKLNLAPVLWVVCGLVTATFGGVTRDIICQQRPRVMYPYRSMYAPPVILGSAVYALLYEKTAVNTQTAAYISMLVTFSSRVLSFNHPMRLPHWTNSNETSATK